MEKSQAHLYPPVEPPQYQPAYGPMQNTAEAPVRPATVIAMKQLGPKSSSYTCPSCNRQIVTKVETKASTKTHLIALALCLLGCWPCVCIPYCMDSCNNAEHYCPSCNAYIGVHEN